MRGTFGKALNASCKDACLFQCVPVFSFKPWENAKPKSFYARDNVENFIRWCRRFGVNESVLFESDGLGKFVAVSLNRSAGYSSQMATSFTSHEKRSGAFCRSEMIVLNQSNLEFLRQ